MKKELEQLIKLAGTPAFKPAAKAANEKYKDNPEAKKIIAELILKEMQATDKRLKAIKQKIDTALKLQLREVSEIVSMSYIAKNYFNKTSQWLSSRVNGNLVNGKPATLKPEEVKILNAAFKDIAQKIGSTKVSLS